MPEKNSLWKNIRNKEKENELTGAKPNKPTPEMLKQENKIKMKSKKYMSGSMKYRKGGMKNKQSGGASDEPTYAGSRAAGLKPTRSIKPRNPMAPTLKNEERRDNKVGNPRKRMEEMDRNKGKAAKSTKTYQKGGVKKAQASIDLLPDGTAEEKAKKAKLLRERTLSNQRLGSMEEMKPGEVFKKNERMTSDLKRQLGSNTYTDVRFRDAEKLPERKPIPPAKKSTAGYEEAKSQDPKLNEYIKARNKAKKGSAAYIAAQNKINAAYDRGPQRDVKKGTMDEAEKKGPAKISSGVKPTLQMRSASPAPAAPASKPKAKTKAKTKVKAKPAKDSIVEDSKEIKFDGPSRRVNKIEKKADRINKRKDKQEAKTTKRAAINKAKEAVKAARRR